jgi:hypothetical protein
MSTTPRWKRQRTEEGSNNKLQHPYIPSSTNRDELSREHDKEHDEEMHDEENDRKNDDDSNVKKNLMEDVEFQKEPMENNFIDNNILVLANGIQYTPGCISLDSIIMILLQVVLPDCSYIQSGGASVTTPVRGHIIPESETMKSIVTRLKVTDNLIATRNNLITLLSLIDTAHDFTKYRTSLTIAQIHNILTINVKYILQYINDTELKDNYQSFLNLLLRRNNIVNNPKFKKPVILKILEIAELPHYTRDVIQEKITTLGTYLFELLGIVPDTNFNYIKSRYYIFYLLHSFIFAKIHIRAVYL